MIGKAPFFDFQDFERLDLIRKYEYFHINKVFGEVYTIRQKDSGKIFVANMTRPECSDENHKSPQRVVNILSELDHPSLLKLVGCSKIHSENITQSVIITEYFSNGTLSDMIQSEKLGHPHPGWNNTKKLIAVYGIASGLQYMHSHNILHRDIKPSKVLMDDSLYPKIRGFNLIVKCDDKASQKDIKSTPEYMAPEIIMMEPSSKPMDVYSFAMTVYEIMNLQRPFEEIKNPNVIKILQKVGSGEMPKINNTTPKAFQKLIERCWAKDPEERPTFKEIVNLLKTDPGFITDDIDKEEYYKYINLIDQHMDNDDELDNTLTTYEDEEKRLREQIDLKNEENLFLRKEIEKLRQNLNQEKEKVQNIILQKERILSSSDFFN